MNVVQYVFSLHVVQQLVPVMAFATVQPPVLQDIPQLLTHAQLMLPHVTELMIVDKVVQKMLPATD